MSSGQNVSITLTIDEAAALKAWTSQQAAVEKLKKKLADLELKKDPLAPLQAGALKAVNTLKDAAVQIVGIGSAVAGLMALANQIKREYQNLKSQQANAAGTNINYAEQLASTVRAVSGKLLPHQVEQLAREGSRQTGQPEAVVLEAFNAAFTAKGPTNTQDALDRAEEAIAVLNQYPEQQAHTKGEITAVTSQNKLAFGLNTQQALGYQQKAQNVSAVKDVTAFATNVGGKLPGIALSGDMTASESATLAGTLSQLGGDREGSVSSLAAQVLGQELKERLPKIPTFKERIAFMQSHPELVTAYEKGGSFPGTAKPFPAAESGRGTYRPHVLAMFNKDSLASREYQKNLQEYGEKDDWERESKSIRDNVNKSTAIQIANAKRAFNTASQNLQLDDVGGAMAAVAREGVQEIMKSVGDLDIQQQLATVSFETNTGFGEKGPLDEAIRQISERERRLSSTRNTSYSRLFLHGFTQGLIPESVQKSPAQYAEDQEKARRLGNARNRLAGINEDFRKAATVRGASVAVEPVATLRDAMKRGETSSLETQERVMQEAEASLNRIGTTGTKSEGFTEVVKEFKSLTEEIVQLRNAMREDKKAVEDNTRAQPKTINPPTPRPTNITTLQNARVK